MIPLWITPESWQAFEEMRKKIKAPLTMYASKLIVSELCKLKASGDNPQDCLDQSIRNGWRDVFPVRDKQLKTRVSYESGTPNDVYERQLAASIAAMK
jgi:hypothetical protein